MTIDIIKARMEGAQKELDARSTELQTITKRAEELNLVMHNIKVQIATYQDLLKDDNREQEVEVKETIESLVAE